MWFSFDGERLWFTTTTSRRKHRNVLANPVLTVSVQDPELPYRYLEVRGVVEEIRPDPEAELFLALSERYGLPADGPPPDAGERVAYAVRPLRVSCQ